MRMPKAGPGFILSVLALSCVIPTILSAQVASAPFNVRAFGAAGDGAANDTTAFNAALAAVPASGGEIYVPAGTYRLTAQLTIFNKSVKFRGEGQRSSILRWEGAGVNGIVYESTGTGLDSNKTLTVTFLSLQKTGAGGIAIHSVWPSSATLPPPRTNWPGSFGWSTLSVDDVQIGGYPHDTEANYWDYGIVGYNATVAKIRNFELHGPTPVSGYAGISLRGQSTGATISKGNITEWSKGIEIFDMAEGITIESVAAVGVQYGFHFQAPELRPGTAIANCNVEASVRAIELVNITDVSIHDNLIYEFPAASNFMGIHIFNGLRNRIANNLIVGYYANRNGIVVEGSSYFNQIQSNITEGMHTGIWLVSPGVTNNVVIGNQNRNYVFNNVYDSSGSPNFVSVIP